MSLHVRSCRWDESVQCIVSAFVSLILMQQPSLRGPHGGGNQRPSANCEPHCPRNLPNMPHRGPVPVKLFKKETAETLKVGPITIRVYEDGSLTENRVSGVLLEVPAGKSGPPMHWHRFHDELFLVTKGSQPSQFEGQWLRKRAFRDASLRHSGGRD
jgi:hypothetical protein